MTTTKRMRILPTILSLAVVTGVSGCALPSLSTGGLFGGGSKNTTVKSVTEEQLLSAAKADFGTTGSIGANVAHGCPRFVVWSPGSHATSYLDGRDGDALAVKHRGEITKTARECKIEPGRVTVKYGFSGRVLLGPAGQNARVSMPVKVFVHDAERQRLSSEDLNIDVDVTVEKPIGYFSVVRTVTFAIPQGTRPGEFEVLVGFDKPGAAAAGNARPKRS